MRIAFYSPLASTKGERVSGDQTQARSLIAALRAEGHEVEVISEYKATRFWRGRSLWRLPRALWAARRRVRELRPDAWLTFVSQWDAPDVMGPLLTARRRIPYLIYKAPAKDGTFYADLRAREGRVRNLWTGLPGWLVHALALRRASFVVVNKAVDFEAYERHPAVRDKLGLLWPAVPLQQFRPDESERARMRQALGISGDTFLLLSVGRLFDERGRKVASLRFLMDATEDLLRRERRVHLVIVGDGDSRAELEAYAAKLGPAVTFAGLINYDDLPAWYNAADVFAYPGLGEYVELVYLEAQACGVPVVAFANGGIPSVVMDGETGFLVEPMDQPAFVQRLDQLVRDGELRRRLGGGGRAYVEQHHDLDSWGRTLARLLTEEAEMLAPAKVPRGDG